jgi:hypothetical protein
VIGYQFTLGLPADGRAEPSQTAWIGLETSFVLREPDGEDRRLEPGGKQRSLLAPALELFTATVTEALVTPEGTLCVEFDDGRALRADPHPDYEAWSITGPGGAKTICMPGGGEPAIWS